MILYAHKDPSLWGERFKQAALELGIECNLFNEAFEVPDSAKAFVRLDQKREQRALSKGLVAQLANRNITTLPTIQEAFWYDSKLEQLGTFGKWLPDTFVTQSKGRAQLAALKATYPFLSKSSEGSASKGVRMINNIDEANQEIEAVFGDGLKLEVYDRVQKDYVYWQKFIPNNPCDYRVIICHKYIFGVIRQNRKDVPFASGSGNNAPMREVSGRTKQAMKFCIEIAKEIATNWMAFDVVFENDKPKLLEISSSWTPLAYAECPVWDLDLYLTDYKGKDMFKMAVEALIA